MTDVETVPFGKYRGQPVERLMADRDYCEWLAAQPWFRERYERVYQLVTDHGHKPQDTPEHNEMQARFLDDDWCIRLARTLSPDASGVVNPRYFEKEGWDVVFGVGGWWFAIECKPVLGDDYPTVLRQMQRYSTGGFDRILLVRRAEFESVTREQVGAIFAAVDIRMVDEADLGIPGAGGLV